MFFNYLLIATLILSLCPDFLKRGGCTQRLRIIYYLPGNTAGFNDGSRRRSAVTPVEMQRTHRYVHVGLRRGVKQAAAVSTWEHNNDTAERRFTDHQL